MDTHTDLDATEKNKFLERDFNQCFVQIRHHDSQIWNVCRFAFTAYIAILGTVIAIYQYSTEKDLDLIPAAIAVSATGFVLGLQIYTLAIRNRVYYVIVCRYINEHRQLFLRDNPLGFKNSTRMYTDPRYPQYLDWTSWQCWLSMIVASLNRFTCGLTIFLILHERSHSLLLATIAGAMVLLIQVISGVAYLRSRED